MTFFDVHAKINSALYTTFNAASDLLFIMNRRVRKELSGNQPYKDRHEGARCFIIATGPSLNKLSTEQISVLSKEYVFGVNSMYKMPMLDDITPRYYALVDNNYWGVASGEFSDIFRKYRENPPVFITDIRAKGFIPENSQGIFLYAKNYPVDRIKFDLSKNMSIAMNVVGYSILCAIYMGFSEIYTLGCDYNLFCSRINNHAYEDRLDNAKLPTYNLAFYLKYYHLTTEIHYLIARLAQEMGVKIVNLTEASLLDAYPIRRPSDVLK